MKSIQVGDRVPDLTLTAQDGRRFLLADFKGKQSIVLFFYAKDNTPICTRQVCSFRDAYGEFGKAAAVVIGVSSDSDKSHRSFAESQRLPYLLVADSDGSLRKSFGVPKTLGILPGRVTYIIDRDGIVRQIINSQFQAQKHVDEALRAVRELAPGIQG
jgi:thioredoxin-dependent peroxiredoxin